MAALSYAAQNQGLFRQLAENNRLLRETLAGVGLDVPDSPSPIIALAGSSKLNPRQLSGRLFDAGILAPFTSYPGSPEGGMIRLVTTAGHTAEQIGQLGGAIGRLL